MVVVIDSSVPGRVTRFLPAWRKCMTMTIGPACTIVFVGLSETNTIGSYGMSLDALKDFLPLDGTLDVKTVRYDTLKVAKRLEAELGDEQQSFIDGDPSDWLLLPQPDGSFKVGIDGGYVRNWFDKKHNFEVIVGKSVLSVSADEEAKSPSTKRLGFVQTLDTQSKRRLYEVLQSQDLQM